MLGMNQGDTGLVVLGTVAAVWHIAVRLIGMFQARGKRVVVEGGVLDAQGMSAGEVQSLLGDGWAPPLKATAEDVRT